MYPNYDKESGSGHYMRLVALAQHLESNFDIFFIFKKLIPSNFSSKFIKIPETLIQEDEIKFLKDKVTVNDIFVLDGYRFDQNYQKKIKEMLQLKLVYIDDFGGLQSHADVIINHAPGVSKKQYQTKKHTKLYLGEQYLLLRKAFIDKSGKESLKYRANTVFVCFGGTDEENLTIRVTEHLLKLNKVNKIIVVLGPNYILDNNFFSHEKIKLYKDISAIKMKNLMCSSSLIIVPSSTLALEALCTGKPIISFKTANNQRLINIGLNQFDHVSCFNSFSLNDKVINKLVSKNLNNQTKSAIPNVKDFNKIFKLI
jgi:UDP-2,4-diacetamido-2,4,6-trideoxy-beta-L-altropyranose hydrolase